MKIQATLRPALIGCVFALTGALAGCAPASDPVAPAQPSSGIPGIGRTAQGDQIGYLAIENAQDVEWDSYEIVDDTHVRISFTREAEPTCRRFDASVTEDAESVRITLREGLIPKADEFCGADHTRSSERVTDTMLVMLTNPLGEREVIDAVEAPADVDDTVVVDLDG